MALLTLDNFKMTLKNNKVHEKTTAEYSFFYKNGIPYLQIDTFGTTTRENPHKVSQSIQLDREVAQHLINILKKNFNLE